MAGIQRKPKAKSDGDLRSRKWWVEKLWIPIVIGVVLALFNKFSQDETQPGKLHVLCNVDSAKVLINNDLRGISAIGKAVVFELRPGQYVVRVEKEGYATFKDDVAIASDQPTTVDAVLEPLDPALRKLKAGFGEPFDPQKINILIADFTNSAGAVDTAGTLWAAKISNELAQFMQDDAALKQVVEVKRLIFDRTGIVIRDEQKAESVGEALNADVTIWGQNLCIKDSICYYAKAFINHDARRVSTIEEGVLQEMQLLRADLPTLIGAKAQVLVKFIIWLDLPQRQTPYPISAGAHLSAAGACGGRAG